MKFFTKRTVQSYIKEVTVEEVQLLVINFNYDYVRLKRSKKWAAG